MIQQVGLNQGGFWEATPKQKSRVAGSFFEIYQAEQEKGITAKQYLATLTSNDLSILQKESCLAEPIDIARISEEGARNLLAEKDQSKLVDLNNDGIVEVGAAKNFVFPPPNAPQAVKDAWEKTTANMTPQEKMRATFPFLCRQFTANIHKMPDGTIKIISPGEPGYRNAFAGDFCDTINQIIDELERGLKYQEPAEQKVTQWKLDVLCDFLRNIQDLSATLQAKTIIEQERNNFSIWDELSQKYDVRNATIDEISDMSLQLYDAGQISLADHATLSFDPGKSPQHIKGTIFLTSANSGNKRDWMTEYQARAELAINLGDIRSYKMDKHILEILEQLQR